ncbi:hypothetical protein QR680_004748 [Steinernema hermaphroditum]|uniref:Potassium channel domain-containing protein n=1 Tax=Steinernema hermaphroditum TaxID=289476 RepID=A0AA39LU68_9BILA|nr:hypothetical protein QR680_004748 [Steinernema hermaphroditum]
MNYSPTELSLPPPSNPPSLRNLQDLSELSAERLNLYLDRHDGDGGMLEQIDEEPGEGEFEKSTRRERFKRKLRIILPHVGLVFLSTLYTLLGAYVFHRIEMPYEIHIREVTAQRVHQLKSESIKTLWNLALENQTTFDDWSHLAHTQMNLIIKDVFIDYTRNYMTPDDIINGTGPVKWSFGASIFFSWTAITTIGYGHIVPRTLKGRIVCLFYALLGIPLILVTIADMGRFLSGGIIWIHNQVRRFRIACSKKCVKICRVLCCFCCLLTKRMKKQPQRVTANNIKEVGDNGIAVIETNANNNKINEQRISIKRKTRFQRGAGRDIDSEAGTFEDISEIQSQDGEGDEEKSGSEDTRARADDLEYEPHHEHRVSVLFILVIMLGYTAGGACLMQLWEKWDFMDSFYFCFVTVTTIGFGDIVPQNADLLPATLAYIVVGLIITTMCIDLVGSEYIRDIHFYGRSLGRSFMTIGGKVVHLGEVFGYVAFLQKNYGLTPEQLDKLAQLPEEYLLDCLINGRQPDLNWLGQRPYVPPDIYYFKWIEHPRTLSFASDRGVLASMESLDLNTSRCSTARTLTPREYYQRILLHYCKQVQQPQNADHFLNMDNSEI